MREILFRGKREENGKWAEGYYLTVKNNYMGVEKSVIITPENAVINGNGDLGGMWIVIPETVGQYIGGVDKNGKMVFEGDIVKFKGEFYVVKYIEKYNRFAGVKPKTIFAVFNFSNAEIVGNIYDNPEMMKGDSL